MRAARGESALERGALVRRPRAALLSGPVRRAAAFAAPKRKRGGYPPWAELLRSTCALDVLECATCKGRMRLVAMVTEPGNIARFLSALGEPTDVPARSPSVHAAATVLEKHRSAPQGASPPPSVDQAMWTRMPLRNTPVHHMANRWCNHRSCQGAA